VTMFNPGADHARAGYRGRQLRSVRVEELAAVLLDLRVPLDHLQGRQRLDVGRVRGCTLSTSKVGQEAS
jgi:hypothetical protein